MSGPKVVRIVTREEIISICEGHLRRLDQTIAIWSNDGKRIKELTDEEIATTLHRRKAFDILLKQNAFMDLQKKVPDEIAFLTADLDRRHRIASEKAVQERKRHRQGRDSASTLIQMLEARDIAIPIKLYEELRTLATGKTAPNMDTILARGFSLLTMPFSNNDLSEAQRTAAEALMVGLEKQDFTTWKATHVPPTQNPRIARIDQQIAELEMLLGSDRTSNYIERLSKVEEMEVSSKQNLILDSLILDLAADLEGARTYRSTMIELRALVAELQAHALTTTTLLERIEACKPLMPLQAITELTDECRTLIAQARQRKEAEARRKVILQGLAQLGYEINEGMETAWATDGRVVAKKTALPGYGVEIGGNAQNGRLQVRAVALEADRDISRDKDVETIWCGEFSKLQGLLADRGDNLAIERALGVGVVPLKVVAGTLQSNLQEIKNFDLAKKS